VLSRYDLSFLPVRGMKVDLGRGDGTMAEKVLNIFDINAFLQKKRSKGMAENVGGDIFFDSGKLRIFRHQVPDRLCR
jgi:hypothetical protein